MNLLADFAGGSFVCALGIMAALLERGSSGKGQVLALLSVHLLQVIDSNMVEGAAYVGSWLFTKNSPAQWGKPRGENLLDSGVHFYETYRTADDQFMSVGCIEPQFYRTFLDKLGIGEEDLPQYENFDNLKGKVAEIFQKKTRKEWCEVCGCRIIPFGNLSRCLMALMLVSPQFWASRTLQTFPTMQPGG